MDHRAHVYSPLQNIAVWLAAWLHGEVSADECLDAMRALGGAVRLSGTHPEDPSGALEVLRLVRGVTDLSSPDPCLGLVLNGPGDAPALRAGSPAAVAAIESSMGAIVLQGAELYESHVLVPRWVAGGMEFQHFAESEPLPAPPYLAPGEADLLLADATRAAADLIESQSFSQPDLPNPRLTVGTLADFYDTPGLPFCTPPRAAKLFARADRVAGIIEAVTARAKEHSLDPVLLPLARNVRIARMSGVSYAVQELAR